MKALEAINSHEYENMIDILAEVIKKYLKKGENEVEQD